MIVETFKQYSPEYWVGKLGKPSASMFSKLVTSTGNKSGQWKKEAFKFAAEIERGVQEDTYQSEYMLRGLEMEEAARKSYEFVTQNKEKGSSVGLVYQDEKKLWCCSPDYLYETKGLEIKCPSPGVHMKYRYENKVPTEYKPQVYGSLWITTDVCRWDFYSYHPDMAPFHIITTRDDEDYLKYVDALEMHLPTMVNFINEVINS